MVDTSDQPFTAESYKFECVSRDVKTQMLVTIIILVLINAILAQLGQFLLKLGMNKIGFIRIRDLRKLKTILSKILHSWKVMVGLVLFISAIIVWFFVIAREELSFVQPLNSIGYIIILIISTLYFKEPLTANRLLGTLVILGGIVIIVSEKTMPLDSFLPLSDIPSFNKVWEVIWG